MAHFLDAANEEPQVKAFKGSKIIKDPKIDQRTREEKKHRSPPVLVPSKITETGGNDQSNYEEEEDTERRLIRELAQKL